MPNGPVIADTTPLVSLWVLGRLNLLRDLYGEVLIPPAVEGEFLAAEAASRQVALAGAPWIVVRPLQAPDRALAFAGLDRGEAEVLALATEQNARLVIIDERAGRRYARRLGLPLTGTMGVLLLAKEAGLIEAVRPLLEALQAAGLHIGKELAMQVLHLAGE